MKAAPLRHDPVATNARAPQTGGGTEAEHASAFGHLLADIDTGAAAKPPAQAATLAPSTVTSPADSAARPARDGETTSPTDVASLVERLLGRDGPGPARTSTSHLPDSDRADATTAVAASPDLVGIVLPSLTPALASVISQTAAPSPVVTSPVATVSGNIPEPTALATRAIGIDGAAGTTESLVAAATGGLATSLDAPAMTINALAVGSQVAPAMITPMSRSLATTASARPSPTSASPTSTERHAEDAARGDATPSMDSDTATVAPIASVAPDDPGPAKPSPVIAGLGGSDMAALIPVSQTSASPVAAVIDAVASMASRLPDEAAAGSSGIALARTMTLQITPGTSGTISIRMRLIGRGLDLKLSVSDPRTLGQIERERDTLSAALHDQSYTLDTLVIQGGDASASGADHDTMHQPAGGGSQAGAGAGGGSGSTGGGGAATPRPQHDQEARLAPSPLGAVFV